jgi:hypothetical protein
VAGAKGAGMTAVWFNPYGQSDPVGDVDLTVTGWADLARQTMRYTHSAR